MGESARLRRQAEELAADNAALLDRVRLRRGLSGVEIITADARDTGRPAEASAANSSMHTWSQIGQKISALDGG